MTTHEGQRKKTPEKVFLLDLKRNYPDFVQKHPHASIEAVVNFIQILIRSYQDLSGIQVVTVYDGRTRGSTPSSTLRLPKHTTNEGDRSIHLSFGPKPQNPQLTALIVRPITRS